VQENQVGLKLNGIHQLLVYVYDVNLQEDNIDTIKKHTETLIDVSKCCLVTRMQDNITIKRQL
jgi:hypothetical protein